MYFWCVFVGTIQSTKYHLIICQQNIEVEITYIACRRKSELCKNELKSGEIPRKPPNV